MSETIWSSFPASSRKDWLAAAQKELKGDDPLAKLAHQSGYIKLAPYYDESDLPDTHLFNLPPSQHQWSEPRHWFNSPKVVVRNVRDANRISLDHLANGADGIFFEILDPQIALDQLLADIELPYCAVCFGGNLSPAFVSAFCSFAGKSFKPSEISGAMFHEKPEIVTGSITDFSDWKNFRPLGIHVKQTNDSIGTLTDIMMRIVKLMNAGDPQLIAANIAVSIDVTHDLFANIAVLKALRILTKAIGDSFSVAESSLFVHGRCEAWTNEKLQPHENMLAGSTAAIAAVLGGCDVLSVTPADADDKMQARVARNVSVILREEARLSLTADPTAGAYYLESLIDTMVRDAWKDFLSKVNS